MKASPLKLVAERSPARLALASRIAEHANAERDHRAAREAVDKARERAWDAQDRFAALQARPSEATANPATAFIAAMQAGREADVAEIEGPAKQRESEEAVIQAEIDALTKTRAALDAAVTERESAVTHAKGKIKDAAAEVIRSEADIPRLLREAEAVAADIVSRRCELLELQSMLHASDERAAIDSFLSRPWLLHEHNRTHSAHQAAQAVTASRDALMRDADAKLGF
jgi:chromosome segregation ATPase